MFILPYKLMGTKLKIISLCEVLNVFKLMVIIQYSVQYILALSSLYRILGKHVSLSLVLGCSFYSVS